VLNLDAARELVEQGLQTRRIGTPLAARIIVHGPFSDLATTGPGAGVADASPTPASRGGVGSVSGLERWTLEMVTRWLGESTETGGSCATIGGDHASRLIAFPSGRSALVSTGFGPEDASLIQILIFGSRGILSCQDGVSREPIAAVHPVQYARSAARPPLPPPYGVLLVAGDHTHQPMYAAAFAADARCRLIGVTDTGGVDATRAGLNASLAERLAIPLLPDLDAALARDDVHIVSICAEPMRRGPIIARAAAAGKHLYLDKPLAGSVAHADDVLAAVRASGVLGHMFSSVCSETISRVRRIVDSEILGRLLAVHCDYCFAKGHAGTASVISPRRESPQPDRYEVADAKRELTNIGVYPLVSLLAVLGRQPRRVSASTGNYYFAEHQARDMEDFGQVLIEFDDGLVATCTAGRTGWRSHPRDGLNRTYLIGSAATAVVDADWPRAEIWSDAAAWQPPQRNPDDPMGMWLAPEGSPYRAAPKPGWIAPAFLNPTADVRYFLDCLANGHDSLASVPVAAAATEILLAAYRSAASGRAVRLPLERPDRENGSSSR
jgi:predicted dehydrogenase